LLYSAGYSRLLEGESADLVLTDPPFNVRVDGNVSGLGKVRHEEFAMASGEMSEAEFTSFLSTFLGCAKAHSRDGAILFVFMDWRHLFELTCAGREQGLAAKNLIVWAKDNAGMGTFYRSRHELVFVFKKPDGAHINTFELGQHGRYRANVWEYAGVNTFRAGRLDELAMHPTVKPVAMRPIARPSTCPLASVNPNMLTTMARLLDAFALRPRQPDSGLPHPAAQRLSAFASFVGMGGSPPIKTLVSLAIGFALAAVGIDTVSGSVRLTMGIDELVKGINFVVAVMGLFGIGELLIAVEDEFHVKAISSKVEWREVFRTLVGLPRYGWVLLRSAAIGCWMGITPGGPTAASFMSYGIAKRLSSRRANFGKGEPEGIIAPETADHAAGTSALLPMLSLGIPGSATAAVMMGGLMIWGLNPGPMLFVEQKDFVWGLIASMYLGNVVAVILVLLTVPVFAALMRVPFFIIAPLIVIICTVGAYSVSNSYLDVVMMMGFGVLGYLFKKLHYPLAPMVLAIVIGDKAEDAFRQSMLMSKGSLSIFLSNTLVTTLVLIGAALLVVPVIWQAIGKMLTRSPLRP
jgi:putative tricarboxylic transport membrane protein